MKAADKMNKVVKEMKAEAREKGALIVSLLRSAEYAHRDEPAIKKAVELREAARREVDEAEKVKVEAKKKAKDASLAVRDLLKQYLPEELHEEL